MNKVSITIKNSIYLKKAIL